MDKKTEITPSEYETVMQNYDREKRIEAYKSEFITI